MELETDHVIADDQYDDDYNNNNRSKADYGNEEDGEQTTRNEDNIYEGIDEPVARTGDWNNDSDGSIPDADDQANGDVSHLQQWQPESVSNLYGEENGAENGTEETPSEQIYDQAFSGYQQENGDDAYVTGGGNYDYDYDGYGAEQADDQTVGGGGGNGGTETAEAFGQSLYDTAELYRYEVDADDSAAIGQFSAAAAEVSV
jgi:hypothetical protein